MKRLLMLFIPAILTLSCGVVLAAPAAAGSGQVVCFDFETGDLQGWRIVKGGVDLPVTKRKILPRKPFTEVGQQGRYFLSSVDRPGNNMDEKTLVVFESPVFRIAGDKATFLLGGGKWDDTFVAMYTLDGAEVRRDSAKNHHDLRPHEWDVTDLRGESVYLRVVDLRMKMWALTLFDNFRVVGTLDLEATTARDRQMREEAWAATEGILGDVEEIIFAVREAGKNNHWYANFGHWAADADQWLYGKGGRLCRLNLKTDKLRLLIDDPEGAVRDPQVHYDGQKILFSYRKGASHFYNLYEINIDGTGLRQLTDGPFDDIEPTYMPDGRIMFCSSRCRRWVNCMLSEVAVLYVCDADGSNMRPISSNNEHDNTPWPLSDGRIVYTRWEYVDRSQVNYHHLWATNPDGTNQTVFYGNLHPSITMIDTKPIPGTRKVVSVFSPGHGRIEHAGPITVVDPSRGPDDQDSSRRISVGTNYRDPYPLGTRGFLVAQDHKIVVMNYDGETSAVYRLPESDVAASLLCQEPRPLMARPREPATPPRVDPTEQTGKLMLANIYHGRNMAGLKPGEIKSLLILESLPKPVNFSGGMEPVSFGGTYTLERIVGTVPVEPDGSAYMELPALRSLFFVALDENDMAVKRMQSFLTVQPGETTSCAGCHEQRSETPRTVEFTSATAMQRPASRIEPITDIPEVFDFPRDIQPILDRHCVACHDYAPAEQGGPRAGGVILCGDRGPEFSHAYCQLFQHEQVSDGRNLPRSNYPPRALGSSASSLLEKLDGSHYEAAPSDHERKMVRLWIDSGAVYAGTYAALGTGMLRVVEHTSRTHPVHPNDGKWPALAAARTTLNQRCGGCHVGTRTLANGPTDNMEVKPGRMRLDAETRRYSRHSIYNLTRPELSMMLLAPLAVEAGGLGVCPSETDGSSVFANKNDPDYQTLLTLAKESKEVLDAVRRFDMPGFLPNDHYVREMKRYGIIPDDYRKGQPIDVHRTDRAYWESLWYGNGNWR